MERIWWTIRWYDAEDGSEHYWSGSWSYEQIMKEAKKALNYSYVDHIAIYRNDIHYVNFYKGSFK